jgi:hypothetical protein
MHAMEVTGCCLRGPRRRVIKRELGQPSQLIVGSQFCTGLEHGSRGIITVRNCYQETSSDDTAEKSPLLEAVATKRLVKTRQSGKGVVVTV